MLTRFFIFLLLPLFALAEADDSTIDKTVSTRQVTWDEPENCFLTSTKTRIAPKVNPVTGEYAEQEVDLIVAGSEPLSLRRFYIHTAPTDPRYGRWIYNPVDVLPKFWSKENVKNLILEDF